MINVKPGDKIYNFIPSSYFKCHTGIVVDIDDKVIVVEYQCRHSVTPQKVSHTLDELRFLEKL